MQESIDWTAPDSGSATSRAAARSVQHRVGTDCGRILELLIGQRSYGATCCEIERMLGLSHQTASARVRQLAKASMIEDSGSTRATRTGRQAIVWRLP